MAYQQVMGQFKQRGDESVKNIPSIAEFAQNHFLDSIMRVGSTGNYWISAVTYQDSDNNTRQQMVKQGAYDLMDFSGDFEYNAYKNMSNQVRRYLGAYSSAYKVGSGFDNYKD